MDAVLENYESMIYKPFFGSMSEFFIMVKLFKELRVTGSEFEGMAGDIINEIAKCEEVVTYEKMVFSREIFPWERSSDDWLIHEKLFEHSRRKKQTGAPKGWSYLVVKYLCEKVNRELVEGLTISPEQIKVKIRDTLWPNFLSEQKHIKFVERCEYLQPAKKWFKEATEKVRVLVLKGAGGIGKSSIASMYQQNNDVYYHGGHSLDVQKQDFIEPLKRQLDNYQLYHPEASDDWDFVRKSTRQLAKICAQVGGRYLLVLDNVGKKTNMADLLPDQDINNIDVIITTRYEMPKPSNSYDLKRCEVNNMNEQEAKSLFDSVVNKTRPRDTDGDVLNLLVRLGMHPLAITLMAHHLCSNKELSITQLLDEIIQARTNHEGYFQRLEGYQEVTDIGDYGLQASFLISIEGLNSDSLSLLMILGLMPLRDTNIKFLRNLLEDFLENCQEEIKPSKRFRINSRGVNSSILLRLSDASLLDQSLSRKSSKEYVRIHEVIHDFLGVYFYEEFLTRPKRLCFENDLTLSFIKLIKSKIEQGALDIYTMRTCAGFLITPYLTFDDFKLSKDRINTSLKFWFDNYGLHQYLYDIGLLENQKYALNDLLKHHKLENNTLTDENLIVLNKFIAHVGYAEQNGNINTRQGFEYLVHLCRERYLEDQLTISKWYLLFSLDHLANFISKDPSLNISNVMECDAIAEPVKEIESLLPESLKENDWPSLTLADFPLLMRAAHYWGHRGNQDAFIMEKKLREDKNTPIELQPLVKSTVSSYEKALAYRMATMYVQDQSMIPDWIMIYLSENLPEIHKWLLTVPATTDKFEVFTSKYQGIGDTANQSRGIAWALLLDICASLVNNERVNNTVHAKLKKLESMTILTQKLWAFANQVWQEENSQDVDAKLKTPISYKMKYELHMPSLEVLVDLIADYVNFGNFKSESEILSLLMRKIESLQNEASYSAVSGVQPDIVRSIHGRLFSAVSSND